MSCSALPCFMRRDAMRCGAALCSMNNEQSDGSWELGAYRDDDECLPPRRHDTPIRRNADDDCHAEAWSSRRIEQTADAADVTDTMASISES